MSVATMKASRRAALRIARPSTAPVKVLWVLLALALVRGLLYAVLNPPFASPDEQAHFQYVAYLATNGSSGPIGAEGNQPATYYALMEPVYWLTAGQSQAVQLLAIRIASIPFLLGIVFFTWLAARKLAPGKPFVPILATSFVALQPQLAYIGASANNDNAANFMAAVLTYLVVSLLTTPARWTAAAMAVALGTAVVTKGQILPMVALSSIVLFCHVGFRLVATRTWRTALYVLAAVAAIALAISTPGGQILVERARSYLSILGHGSEAVGIASTIGLAPFSYQFTSFWAAFVGESVHPFSAWYVGPTLVAALAAMGYSIRFVQHLQGISPIHWGSATVRGLLALTVPAQWVAMYILHLQIVASNPTFTWIQQTVQGRYLLVFVVPLALLVAEGWCLMLRRPAPALVSLGIVAVLAAFDAVSLASLGGYYNWPVSN